MAADSRAAERFAQFLARRDAGEALELEALCAAHPELAAELRALAAEWDAFEPRYARLCTPASPADEEARALLSRLSARPGGARFELRGEVGRGGMGRVLRAFDPDLARELALKLAREDGPREGTQAARAAARFLAEARIAGRLQHPGIVPIHELGLDAEGRLFYTMPLIEGEDLEQVYARVRAAEPGWSVTRALGYLLRVCETMAYAHARGVVHGDLKPANVRIGRFGEVYVMDWGLARAAGATPEGETAGAAAPEALATLHSRVRGTPAYLAPELVLAEHPRADPRGDVYALGAMLQRLLTGSVPRERELAGVRELEALRALVRRAPPPLATLVPRATPPELVAIAARALAAEPAARYADLGSLAEDLRAFLEGRVVRAHAVGPLAELSKWVARNRATAAALLALVLSLGAGLVASTVLYRRANAERAAVLRLADVKRLSELTAAAEGLWPARPEKLAALDAWLAEARELGGRLAAHRATLAELRLRAREPEPGRFAFERAEEQWHHDTLAELVAALARFTAPEGGLLAAVERRRAFALGLDELTRSAPAARARWDEARRSIGDPAECPAYGGLALAPQLGLVPLRRDPRSSLWEFAHLASGEAPALDAGGAPVLTPESGLVLVLLPGGTFRMGAQSADPALPAYSAEAFDNEAPPHAVTLAPFFVAKHELTQAQWLRATGANPSTIAWGASGTEELGWTQAESLVHPVETVSRGECARVLAQLDLVLPTEAQWEYAARGGTETAWWTGDDPHALQGAANLADQTVVRHGGQWPQIEEWLDDGFFRHAPVDALRPNPFGLHCVLGNVWEWCRDDFGGYDLPVRAGDGLRLVPAPDLPVGRGGGYVNDAAYARASLRDSRPDAPHLLFGVRPARALER